MASLPICPSRGTGQAFRSEQWDLGLLPTPWLVRPRRRAPSRLHLGASGGGPGRREAFCWLLEPSLVWASPVWSYQNSSRPDPGRERSTPCRGGELAGRRRISRMGMPGAARAAGRGMGTSGSRAASLAPGPDAPPRGPGRACSGPAAPPTQLAAPRGPRGTSAQRSRACACGTAASRPSCGSSPSECVRAGAGVEEGQGGPDPPSVACSAHWRASSTRAAGRIEDWKKSASQLDKDHAKGGSGPARALQLPTGETRSSRRSLALCTEYKRARHGSREVFGHAEAAEESTQR